MFLEEPLIVIHQRGRVAPEVEKRIRDIMDENDYHPNMLGRAFSCF